jgi:hypothetical protein
VVFQIDGLVVGLKNFLAGDFLLVKSIEKILVFAGEAEKRQLSFYLNLKFLFQIWQLIDGFIDFVDNRVLKVFERNYFSFNCVQDALNWNMRTLAVLFVALTGLVSTDECEIVAIFAAANKSGLFGWRTSSDRGWFDGEGSVIKTQIRLFVFHWVDCLEWLNDNIVRESKISKSIK